MRWIFLCLACLSLCFWPAFGQVNTGELRLKVTDPSGAAVAASVSIVSQGNQYNVSIATNAQGTADIHRVPYGIYLVTVRRQGFTAVSNTVQIGSAIPIDYAVKLEVAPVNTSVAVNAEQTLIDPDLPSSIMQIGSKQIEDRVQSSAGQIGAGSREHPAGMALRRECGAASTRL